MRRMMAFVKRMLGSFRAVYGGAIGMLSPLFDRCRANWCEAPVEKPAKV
jgi:hypothetical protein